MRARALRCKQLCGSAREPSRDTWSIKFARPGVSRRSRCCVSVCPPAPPSPPEVGEIARGLRTIGCALAVSHACRLRAPGISESIRRKERPTRFDIQTSRQPRRHGRCYPCRSKSRSPAQLRHRRGPCAQGRPQAFPPSPRPPLSSPTQRAEVPARTHVQATRVNRRSPAECTHDRRASGAGG